MSRIGRHVFDLQSQDLEESWTDVPQERQDYQQEPVYQQEEAKESQ